MTCCNNHSNISWAFLSVGVLSYKITSLPRLINFIKNLIDWNRLKKFMHVRVYVKCMHTNFSGRGLSGFGDIATFKNDQNSLFDHGL